VSLRGYKRKSKPALWLQIHRPGSGNAKPRVRGKQVIRFTAPLKKMQRIRRVAVAKVKANREYRARAKEVVANARKNGMRCPVVAAVPELRDGFKYGHPVSDKINEVHHRYGRAGRLLLWELGWLLVSKQGHRWVHQNPDRARELGFLCPVGCWNDFKRAMEHECASGMADPKDFQK
jgi:hypothetical protein